MKDIVKKYLKYIEGHDEDWIYDYINEFFATLSRGELCEIMDYLVEKEGDK